MIHSAGHISRLNRESIMKPHQYESIEYSFEELIAEIGSSFLCAKVQINNDAVMENRAAYLAHWLEVLKKDNKFIFKAAAEAQKASDYILNVKKNSE